MYLMYVDESGDRGLMMNGSPTRFFALCGLVVHESKWRDYLDQLVEFRRVMRTMYGLKMKEEIHGSEFITHPGQKILRITRPNRLAILRAFLNEMVKLRDVRVIPVLVDKQGKPATCDVFELAWTALIQRFENTLSHRNFPSRQSADRGVIFADRTEKKKLTSLMRRMRRYNPIPSKAELGGGWRDLPVEMVIEDPNFRDSIDSYYVQAADVAAYFLYQLANPCKYIRQKGACAYFRRLEPILLKAAAPSDPAGLGIVRL